MKSILNEYGIGLNSEIEKLLTNAREIRKLRVALIGHKWGDVAQAIEKLEHLKSKMALDDRIAQELTYTQGIHSVYAAICELRDALRSVEAVMAGDSESFDRLKRITKRARAISNKARSNELCSLLECATLMERLRAAISLGSSNNIRALFDEAESSPLLLEASQAVHDFICLRKMKYIEDTVVEQLETKLGNVQTRAFVSLSELSDAMSQVDIHLQQNSRVQQLVQSTFKLQQFRHARSIGDFDALRDLTTKTKLMKLDGDPKLAEEIRSAERAVREDDLSGFLLQCLEKLTLGNRKSIGSTILEIDLKLSRETKRGFTLSGLALYPATILLILRIVMLACDSSPNRNACATATIASPIQELVNGQRLRCGSRLDWVTIGIITERSISCICSAPAGDRRDRNFSELRILMDAYENRSADCSSSFPRERASRLAVVRKIKYVMVQYSIPYTQV